MNSDVKAGIVALVMGLLYLVATFTTSGQNMVINTPIQPTLFPRIISAGLIISAISILISGLVKQRHEGMGEKEKVQSFFTKERNIILVSFIIYIALFNVLGYKISTLLFSMGTLTFLNGKAWKRNLTFTVIFVLVAYYVFSNTLQIQLPVGIFNI